MGSGVQAQDEAALLSFGLGTSVTQQRNVQACPPQINIPKYRWPHMVVYIGAHKKAAYRAEAACCQWDAMPGCFAHWCSVPCAMQAVGVLRQSIYPIYIYLGFKNTHPTILNP